MITKVFTVYDSKAKAYMSPFFDQSHGAAIRAFSDAAKNPQSAIGRHPEDYTLFYLGEYDDLSAYFDLLPTKESLCTAIEFSNPNSVIEGE